MQLVEKILKILRFDFGFKKTKQTIQIHTTQINVKASNLAESNNSKFVTTQKLSETASALTSHCLFVLLILSLTNVKNNSANAEYKTISLSPRR